MPIITPTHVSAMSSIVSGAMTTDMRMKLARMVFRVREDDWCAPTFPERPSVITYEDHELIDAYTLANTGAKVQADKRRQLGYFGTWRCAVIKAEGEAGMRLAILIDTARTFEGAEVHEEADILLCFAEDQFPSFKRGDIPDGLAFSQVRDWCFSITHEWSLLPRYMRAMKHPRGGVPFDRQQGQRSDAPTFDEPLQGRMPWDE